MISSGILLLLFSSVSVQNQIDAWEKNGARQHIGVDSLAEHIGLATPGVGKVHSLICEHILQIPVP